MEITYNSFTEIPENEVVDSMIWLHMVVFGEPDDLKGRMQEKRGLRIDLALDGEKVVGYKIGYALNRDQFYSWLGGVDAEYRDRGIASELMTQQHLYAKDRGYSVVQTHTKNKWRNMLILNLKSGFDVIGTFTDREGEPKIIMERKLT